VPRLERPSSSSLRFNDRSDVFHGLGVDPRAATHPAGQSNDEDERTLFPLA
jgi:hypothetical protein